MNMMMLKGILLGAKHGIKQNITHKTPWALIDPTLATVMSIKHDIGDISGKNGPEKRRGTLYEMGADLGAFMGSENPFSFLNKPKVQPQIADGIQPPVEYSQPIESGQDSQNLWSLYQAGQQPNFPGRVPVNRGLSYPDWETWRAFYGY